MNALDTLVPGWQAMDAMAFRRACLALPGRVRPALRLAFDAVRAAEAVTVAVKPAPPAASSPVVPAPAAKPTSASRAAPTAPAAPPEIPTPPKEG